MCQKMPMFGSRCLITGLSLCLGNGWVNKSCPPQAKGQITTIKIFIFTMLLYTQRVKLPGYINEIKFIISLDEPRA